MSLTVVFIIALRIIKELSKENGIGNKFGSNILYCHLKISNYKK